MKRNLLILIFILPLIVHGQVTDNFTDGDFTNNPIWSGDTSEFIVNPFLQLQLNSTGTNISSLSVPNNLSSLDSVEWSFWIKQSFSPSSSNYGRVYLASDQSNLEGPLNGYYLQFGEALSNDAVELFQQSGTTSTSICRGTNGQIANSFTIGIKVTRQAGGLWKLYVDGTGGTNYMFEATGTDAAFTSSSFFGVLCSYTTSNAAAFYFDDFVVGFIAPDNTPPAIFSLTVIDATHLDVKFSESVEQLSAETITNYSVNNGIGTPSSATRDASDISLVHLAFSTGFSDGIINTITVNGIKDIPGNTIAANSHATFLYCIPIVALPLDIVINEIMADPDPVVGLPNVEYLELYNRASSCINLNNWTITIGTTVRSIPAITIPSHGYLLLSASTSLLQQYGTVATIFSSPTTLTNAGTSLILKDNSGLIIDAVTYSDSWYRDTNKKDGGWSLERIDPNFTCPNDLNWTASVDNRGGTPGGVNSVHGTFIDHTGPQLLRGILESSTTVRLFFGEPLDPSTTLTASYAIDNGIGAPVSISPSADNTNIQLTVSTPFDSLHIYTISILSGIADCPGNALHTPASVRVAFPKTIDSLDVIINEVLFHPQSGGSEFVELYNRSEKVLNLKDIFLYDSLASNPLYAISAESYLFFPGDYIAITKNIADVKSRYIIQNPAAFIQPVSMPAYTDEGDYVSIASVSGDILDQLVYSQSWQLPLLTTDGLAGVSLERLNPNRPTQDQTNWHSAAESAGFATPGYKNSQYDNSQGDGSELSVDPEIFSPDNDGHNDVVDVHYHFDNPGNVANVNVYDARGRLIRNLVKNELIGNDGSFVWDGITNANDKARVGMYIFYIEVFDINGDTKNYKKTCVLASKL